MPLSPVKKPWSSKTLPGHLPLGRESLYPRIRSDLQMERVTGIEPALSAWEAEVLPLNYTRVAPADVSPRRVRKSNPDPGHLRKSGCEPGRMSSRALAIPFGRFV